MFEAGGNPEPSKGPEGQCEDNGRTRRDFGRGGGEGIAAAVVEEHDGAAGVARSASHYLGVGNDLS